MFTTFYQKFSDILYIYTSPHISSWYYSPLYLQNMMFISSILKNLANKNKTRAQKYIFYLLIKVKFFNNINTIFLKWILYIIIVFSILYIKCLILSFKDMSLLSACVFSKVLVLLLAPTPSGVQFLSNPNPSGICYFLSPLSPALI